MDFLSLYSPTELGLFLIVILLFLPLLAILYAFFSKKVTIYSGRDSKPISQLWKKYIIVIIFSLIIESTLEFFLHMLWGTVLETNIYLDYFDTGIMYLFPLLVEMCLINFFISDMQNNKLGLKLSASIVIVNFIVLMSIIYGFEIVIS